MDVLSKSDTLISDVLNRILKCREINNLYIFGEVDKELDYLYPVIKIIPLEEENIIAEDVIYIRVNHENELYKAISWVKNNKEKKDFIIYVSSDINISDKNIKVLGIPHNLSEYSSLTGVLFLVGQSFQLPPKLEVPNKFKVLAIIHFYNEADIIEKTIQYLLKQEVNIYLLDNWSDDGSYEIAQKYQRKYPDKIYLEQFPPSGKSENYEWYNQLERTEQISRELEYDWFIHYDVDEMRVSPWEGVTLKKAIYWIDRQGYNGIENTVIDFRITKADMDNIFMSDTFFDFRHKKIYLDQFKTWKKTEEIELKSTAGHCADIAYPKIYPLKILNRHYPMRDVRQAEKKIFIDRKPRFKKENAERGWHGHYEKFKEIEDIIFDAGKLLLWEKDTFEKLYIPLFMECGVMKEEEDSSLAGIKLPDITRKSIVVYGAGNIGKKVYSELEKRNNIVAWVDKRYKELKAPRCKRIVSPEEVRKLEYDYVVLAVINRVALPEIVRELEVEYGIAEEKILFIERKNKE